MSIRKEIKKAAKKVSGDWLEGVELNFPKSLKTDNEGFTFLAELKGATQEKKCYFLVLTNVTWLEANLCAVLGAIIHSAKQNGSKFYLREPNSSQLLQTLKNNGFVDYIENKKISIKNKITSSIAFTNFKIEQEKEMEAYIEDILNTTSLDINISKQARKKIVRSLFELYQNSVMHSGAAEVFVCGQFYKYKKRVALTMVEFGRSFKDNVSKHKEMYKDYSAKECIAWAVESGNTTKEVSDTGGLGLDLIRGFLQLNEGKIQIRSSKGYWEEKKGVIFAEDCENLFQGSIVNVEFNLRDENQYIATAEVDPNSLL